MELDRLIAISQDLGLLNETVQLQLIKERSSKDDCELILPLVGEYNAGKTTLINALLDSNEKLETDFKPTTATLFEIHFGAERCYAQVINENGSLMEFEHFSDIKNDDIKDSLVVNVFDTSQKVSSNIILVDTPGLSSPIAKHRQVLIDFLPKADAILFVVDINAQMTHSLTDFISKMKLAKRPVFLIISQCDTKSELDAQKSVDYLSKESELPLKQIICVSAKNGNLQPLYDLLASILQEKCAILAQVNDQRIKNITNSMVSHIDEMLSASISDKDLKQAIQEKESELRSINNKIDLLINHSQTEIEDEMTRINRKFEDTIFTKLDSIVSSNCTDYDSLATIAINNIASIFLNDFKSSINNIIMDQCLRKNDTGIDFQCIQNIDLSHLHVEDLTHGLDLNSIGHEYDSKIALGLKVVAAAALAALVGPNAGAAEPVAEAVGKAITEKAVEVAVTKAEAAGSTEMIASGTSCAIASAKDVDNKESKAKNESRIEKVMQNYAKEAGKQYDNINKLDEAAGKKTGQSDGKGLIEGIVGLVTDKAWGKPQRRRAIHNYLDESLMPQFKNAMTMSCNQVIKMLKDMLLDAAKATIAEKKLALEDMNMQHETQKELFAKRLSTLRDYKNELLTQ